FLAFLACRLLPPPLFVHQSVKLREVDLFKLHLSMLRRQFLGKILHEVGREDRIFHVRGILLLGKYVCHLFRARGQLDGFTSDDYLQTPRWVLGGKRYAIVLELLPDGRQALTEFLELYLKNQSSGRHANVTHQLRTRDSTTLIFLTT